MALYIRDPAVDSLVEQYQAAAGLPSKTEAVRRALSDQLKALAAKGTLAERVAKVQRQAAEAGFLHTGPSDPAADKKFMDDMWGED